MNCLQWKLDMKREGERASWSVERLHSGTWGSPGRQVGAKGGQEVQELIHMVHAS